MTVLQQRKDEEWINWPTIGQVALGDVLAFVKDGTNRIFLYNWG